MIYCGWYSTLLHILLYTVIVHYFTNIVTYSGTKDGFWIVGGSCAKYIEVSFSNLSSYQQHNHVHTVVKGHITDLFLLGYGCIYKEVTVPHLYTGKWWHTLCLCQDLAWPQIHESLTASTNPISNKVCDIASNFS